MTKTELLERIKYVCDGSYMMAGCLSSKDMDESRKYTKETRKLLRKLVQQSPNSRISTL